MATALDKLMELGSANYKITEILDNYNCRVCGTPELVAPKAKLVTGKCILVTGHDLADLSTLLDAAEKRGINVYTNGEMLPALAYPVLNKHRNLIGNFGHAWWKQQTEFEMFPGPILFTTNCIMKPKQSYIHKCFTTSMVGYDGVRHIERDCWDELLEAADALKGFESDEHCRRVEAAIGQEYHGSVGFNYRTFDKMSSELLNLIKDKKIKGFKFVGGCDGFNVTRNYFTNVAENCPKDWIVLTGACGRFKVN